MNAVMHSHPNRFTFDSTVVKAMTPDHRYFDIKIDPFSILCPGNPALISVQGIIPERLRLSITMFRSHEPDIIPACGLVMHYGGIEPIASSSSTCSTNSPSCIQRNDGSTNVLSNTSSFILRYYLMVMGYQPPAPALGKCSDGSSDYSMLA